MDMFCLYLKGFWIQVQNSSNFLGHILFLLLSSYTSYVKKFLILLKSFQNTFLSICIIENWNKLYFYTQADNKHTHAHTHIYAHTNIKYTQIHILKKVHLNFPANSNSHLIRFPPKNPANAGSFRENSCQFNFKKWFIYTSGKISLLPRDEF